MATTVDTTMLASRLRLALGHLVRRMRAEHRFPLTQGSVLGRLDREGRKSIGDLAALERVRPQSMTQTIADLESDGLIERSPDPTDGRRTLVELTESGLKTLHEDRRNREGWLARAIADDLTPREQRLLADALPLLERLADD
ncbi:MAG TPA: MarR family transcriptional regulator [Solirubrobacteraceae bacterium]|nr:MarR family transcriptional regulator [Solirubrobacteraceae bacterium]